MSDLISRSKVIAVLEQLEEHSLSGKMDISNAIYLLNNQPIAYDIDKVVEELEEMKTIKGSMKTVTCRKWDYGTVNRAIEIVKQGGVSDDVCEWKVKSNYYVTKCSHDTDIMYGLKQDFKFCPYCGKKIKVVE